MPKDERSAARKIPGFHFLAARLNRGIRSKQAGQVKHRHLKGFTDEVTRLIDRDAVSWGGVAVQHENPIKAVLRKLSANVRHK